MKRKRGAASEALRFLLRQQQVIALPIYIYSYNSIITKS